MVPWLRQRLASFQNPSLQGMAGEKKARTRWAVRFCLFRRSRFTSAPCSFFELCPFCVAGVGRWGHFELWNVVLHGRCRKLDTFSSVCMCGAFCTLLKRCNVGTRESKREMVLEVIFRGRRGIWWTWTTFWKGRTLRFCETVVEFDLGHVDDSVKQVRHFGCLGLNFRGRRNTL